MKPEQRIVNRIPCNLGTIIGYFEDGIYKIDYNLVNVMIYDDGWCLKSKVIVRGCARTKLDFIIS